MPKKSALERLADRFEILELKVQEMGAKVPPTVSPTSSSSVNGLLRMWRRAVAYQGSSLIVAILAIPSSVLFTHWFDHRNDYATEQVDKRIETYLGKEGGVSQTLNLVKQQSEQTNSALMTLQPFVHDVIEHQFETLSHLPQQALLDRAPAVSDLLQVARSQRVFIKPTVIDNAGLNFVRDQKETAATWKTALQFLEYKSFINSAANGIPTGGNLFHNFVTHYNDEYPVGKVGPKVSYAGVLPISEAAQFDYIGSTANSSLLEGDAVLFADGGDLIIDNKQLRNVVLRGVKIHYSGGPVRMQNVFFVNCTFEMTPNSQVRGLAVALLNENPSISYVT